jgi:hypothetical protein
MGDIGGFTEMSVQMAQARIKPDKVTAIRAGASRLFAAIETAHPEGIRYAWLLYPDGETFVALVQADDGVENPIPALPEFRELQEGMADALVEPPSSRPLTVVASYRMF